eukprot:2718131-Pleurochrysis_carterae.AAC.2
MPPLGAFDGAAAACRSALSVLHCAAVTPSRPTPSPSAPTPSTTAASGRLTAADALRTPSALYSDMLVSSAVLPATPPSATPIDACPAFPLDSWPLSLARSCSASFSAKSASLRARSAVGSLSGHARCWSISSTHCSSKATSSAPAGFRIGKTVTSHPSPTRADSNRSVGGRGAPCGSRARSRTPCGIRVGGTSSVGTTSSSSGDASRRSSASRRRRSCCCPHDSALRGVRGVLPHIDVAAVAAVVVAAAVAVAEGSLACLSAFAAAATPVVSLGAARARLHSPR